MTAPCLLIAAGGTGGHIFPGLAVAEVLRGRGWRIEWLGSHGGLEEQLVPARNIPLHLLAISGLRGKGIAALVTAPLRLLSALLAARKVLQQTNADVVLGMGGFASGPGGLMARLTGRALVIHEQNAVAGMTNKWLARVATVVLAAFPQAFATRSVRAVGNPVRKELLQLAEPVARFAERSGALRVLVIGGSRGAAVLNETVPSALAQTTAAMEVWHQTGRGQHSVTAQRYGSRADVKVSEFIDDMAAAYSWADVVICRAGALTVSEIAAVGVPAIFVPYPHAVDDHQTANARYLSERNAAWLLPQNELTEATLATRLQTLAADRALLQRTAQAARAAAITDAAEQVAAVCEQLLKMKQDDDRSNNDHSSNNFSTRSNGNG
ncbi:undecaprenyldiphospho-muramoylpentapeptide beta-N-acetylglucosaminyltransferase [Permianibacter sp. IMCC34836]|uniref:undecaprenyldiphospho-muramoylpentapeptide beta-N-acetylglucosaminyltransferase n=1 Tax=Permianibacter fluminis TaxID=2738515 RepID=UPI0015577ED7|nr:undecaprenyldiphospho-muramoylpentapeptide beta-N-acetylglucosaminyltransferase [Permianibacter fluminis]NQD37014.1 undecaprenyldiphospho-muramoylpentapeptide beta-N-acetylglucosaminyltransferase [Permianibacter fluminis]